MFLRYNELRGLIGSADAIAARELVADPPRRARGGRARSIRATGSAPCTPSQLAFPYLVNWGYPDRFHQQQSEDQRLITGIGGVAGRRRGDRPGRPHGRRVRRGPRRRHPRLPDDEPGLGRAVHEDRRARHRHRRHDLASGGALARVRDPGRHRHVRGDPADRDRRPASRSTGRPGGSRSCATRAAGDAGATRPSRDRALRAGRMAVARIISRSVLADQVKDRHPRGHPERPLPAGLADHRDPGRPRARDEPGAGPRGAPRARGPRGRRDHPVPRRPRPPPVAARDPRGLRRPLDARGARRAAGRARA